MVKAITINEAVMPEDYLKPGAQIAIYSAVEAANRVASQLGMTVSMVTTNYGCVNHG